MIKAERLRRSHLGIGIDWFIAYMTMITIQLKNMAVIHFTNRGVQLASPTAYATIFGLLFVGLIVSLPALPALFKIMGVSSTTLAMSSHLLNIRFWLEPFCPTSRSTIFQVLYPELMIVLTSTFLAIANIPILPVPLLVKVIAVFLYTAFSTYFRQDKKRKLHNDFRLMISLFSTCFTDWSITVATGIHLMEFIKGFLLLAVRAIFASWFGWWKLFDTTWLISLRGMVYFLHDFHPLTQGVGLDGWGIRSALSIDNNLYLYYTTNPPQKPANTSFPYLEGRV